jgi:hypothetical protein
VAARLKRDVHRRAARLLTRRVQRDDLRVIQLVELVEAFADDDFVSLNHCADDGIGVRQRYAFRGEPKRAQHPLAISVANAVSRRGN